MTILARSELLILRQGRDTARPPAAVALTARQGAALALLADEASNQNIGQRLGIDTGTAKLHVAAILKRLGVANRTAAIAEARRHGIV